MATVVLMPKVGISVESCIITQWHKKKGDAVKEGDVLFTYETDKASVDEEAKVSGTMLELFYEEGAEVAPMVGVCVIGEPGEDISSLRPEGADAAEQPAETAAAPEKPSAEAPAVASAPAAVVQSGKVKASPRACNLAEKIGADLHFATPTGAEGRVIERDVRALQQSGKILTGAAAAQGAALNGITGTGIGGKITIADLTAAPEAPAASAAAPAQPAASAEPAFEAVKMPHIRQLIAKSMKASLSSMAQLTNNASFDATELMALRAKVKANAEQMGLANITLNDMLLFAVSRTLKNHRSLNANLIGDTLYYYNDVNLGVAVDTERGLMVPTLFAADKKSLAEISREAKELIDACKKGSISPDLLKGGTFTVTNLGSLGVESFTPVINPPQTGILGVCTVVQKVRVVNGEIKAYPSMGLSLTYDHSAVDGAPAARFLQDLKKNLENFSLMLTK